MKINGLVKSATIIAAGNLISKVVGVAYRIPLTNILGSSGIGIYQMVFPLYCILLDLSGSGIPSGLSKIISENNQKNAQRILKSAIKLMAITGFIATVIMALLSYPISLLQGDVNAFKCYLLLCPSLFFVSLISCYRGYFQGRENMYPTAISNVVEQIVKAVLGLIISFLLSYNLLFAVNGSVFAITLSEFFAFLLLVYIYRKSCKNSATLYKNDKKLFIKDVKNIVKISLPISFISIVLPLSQIVDSIIIINALYNGTSLYGLFSGAVSTIINLPVSICYGIGVALIPQIAKGNNNFKKAIGLTVIISLSSAVIIYLFSPQIIGLLFRNFTVEEKIISANLLKVTCIAPVLLSLTQTFNGYFIGKGKQYIPLISLTFGVIVKIFMELLLVPNSEYNIFGAGVSLVSCYLVAVTFNLMYYIKGRSKKVKTVLQYGN